MAGCELTGKGNLTGHNVSHSNRKTKRRFSPNLVTVRLTSETLRKTFKFKIAASVLRTINHKGGLDEFLYNTKAKNLTSYGQKLRRKIKKTTSETKKAA